MKLFKITSVWFLFIILVNPLFAQNINANDYNLRLERVNKVKNIPEGWYKFSSEIDSSKKDYELLSDTLTKKSGANSFLLSSTPNATQSGYSGLARYVPAKYEGKEIELRAFMKLENVSNYVGLMLRVDDAYKNSLQFSNLDYKRIRGTKNWKMYSVKLPLPSNAHEFFIGPILSGTGKLWVDDIQLLVDGKDISEAPLKAVYDSNPPSLPRYGEDTAVGKRIKLANGELYYEVYGQGEPLVLLHGNSQSIKAFQKQIPELSKLYKVIAVDTRGHGKSTDQTQGPLTYDLFANDIKQLMDSLNISKANILGWSDGGNTGLIMAIKYPAYVNKLVVMGAAILPGKEAVGSKVANEVQKSINDLVNKQDEAAKLTVRLYRMLLLEPNINIADLKEITLPVLVMAGEHDMILPQHTKLIADNIPGSKLVILNGATHFAPFENAEAFNKAIIKFFKSDSSIIGK